MSSLKKLLMCSVTIACLSGCDQGDKTTATESTTAAAPADDSQHAHGHPSDGPHHGDLIELGNDEYHAELIHPGQAHSHNHAGEQGDHDGVVVYVLDDSAVKQVAIAAPDVSLNLMVDGKPAQFKLMAKATVSDADGKSSRFVSDNKDLAAHLADTDHVEGTLVLTIDGKSFRGKITDDHHSH